MTGVNENLWKNDRTLGFFQVWIVRGILDFIMKNSIWISLILWAWTHTCGCIAGFYPQIWRLLGFNRNRPFYITIYHEIGRLISISFSIFPRSLLFPACSGWNRIADLSSLFRLHVDRSLVEVVSVRIDLYLTFVVSLDYSPFTSIF